MDKPDVRALAEDVPARRWICCAIEATWGERCPDFDPTCATCRTWAEYDALTATRDTAKADGRREGLEEAATVAERAVPGTIFVDGHNAAEKQRAFSRERQRIKDIASAIRALAQKAETP